MKPQLSQSVYFGHMEKQETEVKWKLEMADLHDDVTYKGWGKTSTACHRQCMGIL